MNVPSTQKKNFKQVKENTFFLDFVRITGFLPVYLWKRPKVYYMGDRKKCHPKGGILIASNHISFTDPLLLYCVFLHRRIRFLATKDLYKNALISFLFSAAGCIQVDKDNFNIGSLRKVVDKLKAGKPILIFPEGQVNKKEAMLTFKSGAVLMAQLSGAPIQPVFITKREKWYQWNKVVVGEPIDICSMCSRFHSMDEIDKVGEIVREKEKELEEYFSNHIAKTKGVPQ